MEDARCPARQAQPRSLWPARPPRTAFGRLGSQAAARRLPSPASALQSRLLLQPSQQTTPPGDSACYGYHSQGQGAQWLGSSQLSQEATPLRPLSLRERVQAAIDPQRHLGCAPPQLQRCTPCAIPLPSSSPYDSQPGYDSLLPYELPACTQPPVDAPVPPASQLQQLQSMRSDQTPSVFHLAQTQVSRRLPQSQHDLRSSPPAVVTADAGIQWDAHEPEQPVPSPALVQRTDQLVAMTSALQAQLQALADSSTLQQAKLTALQGTCKLVLKGVQALLKRPQPLEPLQPPVTHECAVQASAQPAASVAAVAVQTSLYAQQLPPAQARASAQAATADAPASRLRVQPALSGVAAAVQTFSHAQHDPAAQTDTAEAPAHQLRTQPQPFAASAGRQHSSRAQSLQPNAPVAAAGPAGEMRPPGSLDTATAHNYS